MEPKLPLVPGHEIVGSVVEKGERVERFDLGQRVGVLFGREENSFRRVKRLRRQRVTKSE